MRYSQIFTKTRKEAPADEVSRNAQLLIRAGYIYKVMAGVYAFNPLGLMVLENIKAIIREEMNLIQGQEVIMTSLQRKDTWENTGRWDDDAVDVWFKSKLKDGTDVGFGWSHEEPILEMMQQHITSYKDLPVSVYQFQTKFRNELRAKSGIMRGREFIMKDMYSLHATQEDMDEYYDKVIEAYGRIFDRLGIGDQTFVTFASGGAFTKFSHEFQTICDAGEDVLYISDDQAVAVNEEVLADAASELNVNQLDLSPVKTAEVGNIFKFGTEKSNKMDIRFTAEDGTLQPVYLASYGMGVTRVMGVIAEKMSDDKGLSWPDAIAPFRLVICRLGNNESTVKLADKIYDHIVKEGISVLYDDRNARPGQKFADADLMGVPHRIVVGDRTVDENSIEYKSRLSDKNETLTLEDLTRRLKDLN